MGNRNKQGRCCERCLMLMELCICNQLPRIRIPTRIVLLQHRRELHRVTNTGWLALLMLENCQHQVRGLKDQPMNLEGLLDPNRRELLLFPRPDAHTLSPAIIHEDPRPITLLVPDGTWEQARRVIHRESLLKGIPAVTLPPGSPSRYQLRHSALPQNLSTIETIARALGIIESKAVQTQIEEVFVGMVQRIMALRLTRRRG